MEFINVYFMHYDHPVKIFRDGIVRFVYLLFWYLGLFHLLIHIEPAVHAKTVITLSRLINNIKSTPCNIKQCPESHATSFNKENINKKCVFSSKRLHMLIIKNRLLHVDWATFFNFYTKGRPPFAEVTNQMVCVISSTVQCVNRNSYIKSHKYIQPGRVTWTIQWVKVWLHA